jgi:hypothetical protein
VRGDPNSFLGHAVALEGLVHSEPERFELVNQGLRGLSWCVDQDQDVVVPFPEAALGVLPIVVPEVARERRGDHLRVSEATPVLDPLIAQQKSDDVIDSTPKRGTSRWADDLDTGSCNQLRHSLGLLLKECIGDARDRRLSYELGVERPFLSLWQLLDQRLIGLTKFVHSE